MGMIDQFELKENEDAESARYVSECLVKLNNDLAEIHKEASSISDEVRRVDDNLSFSEFEKFCYEKVKSFFDAGIQLELDKIRLVELRTSSNCQNEEIQALANVLVQRKIEFESLMSEVETLQEKNHVDHDKAMVDAENFWIFNKKDHDPTVNEVNLRAALNVTLSSALACSEVLDSYVRMTIEADVDKNFEEQSIENSESQIKELNDLINELKHSDVKRVINHKAVAV